MIPGDKPYWTLWYFGPFPAKRCLEMIDTLVFLLSYLSKMPQAQKSNGLRSGDFGGYYVVEMKRGTTFLSHSDSCWSATEKLACLGINTVFKTFYRQYSAFNLTPRSMNTSGKRPSAPTAAYTITIDGARVLMTNRSLFNICCIRLHDMFTSRTIFLRREFRSNMAFPFRIISGIITVFFRPLFGSDPTVPISRYV